jgi:hypothetical protein
MLKNIVYKSMDTRLAIHVLLRNQTQVPVWTPVLRQLTLCLSVFLRWAGWSLVGLEMCHTLHHDWSGWGVSSIPTLGILMSMTILYVTP